MMNIAKKLEDILEYIDDINHLEDSYIIPRFITICFYLFVVPGVVPLALTIR